MTDVIIPAYNAHSTIDRALASIAMQTVRDRLNVIIADDCSDTGYGETAERWKGILPVRIVRLAENAGPGAARQAGFDAGSGELVTFMDADDTFFGATALEELEEHIASGADAAVAGFYEQLADGRLLPHGANMTWMFGKLYRRDLLERFDIRFNSTRANEDAGFNGVVKSCTRRIAYINEPVYLWHFKADSITRANGWAYTSRDGFNGFVENMIWRSRELARRGLGAAVQRDAAVEGMCAIYFAYLDGVRADPAAEPALRRRAADYWREVYSRAEPCVGGDCLRRMYLSAARSNRALLDSIVPRVSICDFIEQLKKETENGRKGNS